VPAQVTSEAPPKVAATAASSGEWKLPEAAPDDSVSSPAARRSKPPVVAQQSPLVSSSAMRAVPIAARPPAAKRMSAPRGRRSVERGDLSQPAFTRNSGRRTTGEDPMGAAFWDLGSQEIAPDQSTETANAEPAAVPSWLQSRRS
jgi:hypothetical protein